MQKAIYIENTDATIARVLAYAPFGTKEIDGRQYIDIEDYYVAELKDVMDKAYPIYNKTKKEFGYIIESWTITANQDRVDLENLKAQATNLIAELETVRTDQRQAIMELTQMISMMAGGGTSEPMPMP